MTITHQIGLLLTTTLALSLVLLAMPIGPTDGSRLSIASPPSSSTISASIFFTDSNLKALPLDRQGNPSVNATIASLQHCSGYTGKQHTCVNPRSYYSVQNTNPAQLIAWINITATSGTPLQSLRLNETIPGDWAVSPAWTLSRGAIHLYYDNTTRVGTDPEITQPPTINVVTRTPEVVRIAIPNFNTTAIGHPVLARQSILASVNLTYTPLGGAQSSVSYPKNYNFTVATATWTQASYKGTESTKNASAFFITYAIYPASVNAPPKPFLDSVLGLLDSGVTAAIIIAIGFGIFALARRRKRSLGYPTSTPQP